MSSLQFASAHGTKDMLRISISMGMMFGKELSKVQREISPMSNLSSIVQILYELKDNVQLMFHYAFVSKVQASILGDKNIYLWHGFLS
jgi:hypothetical protein